MLMVKSDKKGLMSLALQRSVFFVLFFILPKVIFGSSVDEIINRVRDFIQYQEQILSIYTARVNIEKNENKGRVIATGTIYFQMPDKVVQKIDEITYIGEAKKIENYDDDLFPLEPFELYTIFKKKGHKFEYIGENENAYLLKVTPIKGCEEPFKGTIEIDKKEFAIVLVDVEASEVNLGLFHVKARLKERFIKVDRYWVLEEMVSDLKIRKLFKKERTIIYWRFSNYKIN